jgi:hypothetical protein
MPSSFEKIILYKVLYLGVLNIFDAGIHSFLRDIASYKLHIDFMTLNHLLEIIKLTFELLVLFPLVHGPVLKGHLGFISEISNWLVQKHH